MINAALWPNDAGKEVGKADFSGKKIPDLPPRPDLSKLAFGTPVRLLNGNDLAGWKVMNEKAPNCWSMADGMLSNRVAGPDGKKQHGTNIRTVAEFEDFNLKTEVQGHENWYPTAAIYNFRLWRVMDAVSFALQAEAA